MKKFFLWLQAFKKEMGTMQVKMQKWLEKNSKTNKK